MPGGREAAGRGPDPAEPELLGVIHGDGCLEEFRQAAVDPAEAFEEVLGFVLPAGEEEDRGAVPEEHEPEGVANDQPGEAQLAGFEDDDLGVVCDGAGGRPPGRARA